MDSAPQRPSRQVDSSELDRIDAVMRRGLQQRVYPGAVLLVGIHGQVVFHRAYGMADLFSGRPMTCDTIFDLASLTKPLATTLACMRLVQEGRLDLDRPFAEIWPGPFKGDQTEITPRHLLSHTSGLPPWMPYYMRLRHIPPAERVMTLKKWIRAEPLLFSPGQKDAYSDLGFILLQWIIEKICGQSLDRWVHRKIYHVLGIGDLFFIDLNDPDLVRGAFAATELCPWRHRLVCGQVHDDNAFVMGGVAGHAGLFGKARSVYDMLHTLLCAEQDDGADYLFAPEVVRAFFQRQGSCRFALGFDTPAKVDSSAGKYFPADSIGHLGFSGTSFWVHRSKQLVVVLLTNRIHPSRYHLAIKPFRPLLHDTIMEALGEPGEWLKT